MRSFHAKHVCVFIDMRTHMQNDQNIPHVSINTGISISLTYNGWADGLTW